MERINSNKFPETHPAPAVAEEAGSWRARRPLLDEWDERLSDLTAVRAELLKYTDPQVLYEIFDNPTDDTDWESTLMESIRMFSGGQHLVSVFHARYTPDVVTTMEGYFLDTIENFHGGSIYDRVAVTIPGFGSKGDHPQLYMDVIAYLGDLLAQATESVYSDVIRDKPYFAHMFLARAQAYDWSLEAFQRLPTQEQESLRERKNFPRFIPSHQDFVNDRLRWPKGYEETIPKYIRGEIDGLTTEQMEEIYAQLILHGPINMGRGFHNPNAKYSNVNNMLLATLAFAYEIYHEYPEATEDEVIQEIARNAHILHKFTTTKAHKDSLLERGLTWDERLAWIESGRIKYATYSDRDGNEVKYLSLDLAAKGGCPLQIASRTDDEAKAIRKVQEELNDYVDMSDSLFVQERSEDNSRKYPFVPFAQMVLAMVQKSGLITALSQQRGWVN